MQLATAGHFETVGAVGFFYTEAYIRVQFPEQAVAQMPGGNVFSLLAGKRTVIYDKLYRDSRL